MRHIMSSLLVFAALVVSPMAVSAAPITVPTDLNPGDQYRLAFVTSTTRDATSTAIADYNAFVAAVAAGVPELAALGTTWTAIGSTATDDARDNTGTNPTVSTGVPIYRLDNQRIANNNADLWDGAILFPINHTENGVGPVNVQVYTGTTESGLVGGAPLFSALGGINPTTGNTFFPFTPLPRSWIDWTTTPPVITSLPMYATSGVLTVVPEPNSIALAAFGFFVLAGMGWKRRKR